MSRTLEQDLSDPGLARLFAAARAKFEARGEPSGSIKLEALMPAEAVAIDTWWKRSARRRPRRDRDFRCTLRELDESLTEMAGLRLEQVLVRLGGPLRLRPQERSERHRLAAAFWDEAMTHPLCGSEPRVLEWLELLRRSGRLGSSPTDSSRGTALLASLELGSTLPRHPPVERSTFAAEMLGDPHALDERTAVGGLLTSQLAAREGFSAAGLTAGQRRSLLQRFGVLCDPASATVLTLGLRPIGDSPLERALRLLHGTHVVLTLGQLSRAPLQFEAGITVRLCENPAVVLRAESLLGGSAGPLVCTGGWPGSATCALLDAMRRCGAAFAHHGDFDWDGLAIWRWVRDRYDAQPWRFNAEAYRESTATAGRLPALGSARQAPDPDDPLAVALLAGGLSVPEEVVLEQLVDDLAHASPTPLQMRVELPSG